jgi:hypothetical protein
MFGCLGRIGCLVLAVLIAGAAWLTRDAWYPRIRARVVATTPPAAARWEPLTPEGAARARAALESLTRKNGPVFVNVNPADLAALVLDSVVHGFSPGATGAEVLSRDDHLYLRAQVSVADLGGPGSLGPLSSLVAGKQEFTVRGRLEAVRPGWAQFRVDEIALKELKLPSAVIAKLVGRIATKDRDAATPADAIPLRIPREIADVRTGKGRITLYKNVP